MFLSISDTIQGLISNFSFPRFLQVTLVLAGGAFVLGIILRAILGKGSELNKSIGAAFGILMIYIVSVAINIENHYEIFMNPLPYLSITGDTLSVIMLKGAPINIVCEELVKMIFLAVTTPWAVRRVWPCTSRTRLRSKMVRSDARAARSFSGWNWA